jgi:capsular exopolysaccharide synthesis family protein
MPDKMATGSDAEVLSIPAKLRPYYEMLCERALLCVDDAPQELRIIALTSSVSQEGVSTVAANLAVTLARHAQGSVLFVDANLRRPAAHRIFGVKISPGLWDMLVDGQRNREIIHSSPQGNLFVLSSGRRSVSLAGIYRSRTFTNLLERWRRQYRFVVFDLPPVSEDSSAIYLANLADGVIWVVEAERLRWQVARRTKERLLEAKVNLLGVVLNKRRFPVPEWLYRTL